MVTLCNMFLTAFIHLCWCLLRQTHLFIVCSYFVHSCYHVPRSINAVEVLTNATSCKVFLIQISFKGHMVWVTCSRSCTYRIVLGIYMWKALQICEPPSFASISLSIPFAQDCGQILLYSHLLPIATVAVRENSVRVALGQRLFLLYRVASAQRKDKRQSVTLQHHYTRYTYFTL